MAHINSLSLKNYRSFGSEKQSLTLGKKITILIGPNNSGKSNILRALREILSSNITGSVPQSVNRSAFERVESEASDIDKLLLELRVECIIDPLDKQSALDSTRTQFEDFGRAQGYEPITTADWEIGEKYVERLFEESFSSHLELDLSVYRKRGGNYESVVSRNTFGKQWREANQKLINQIHNDLSQSDFHPSIQHMNVQSIIDNMVKTTIPNAVEMSQNLPKETPENVEGFASLRTAIPSAANLRNYIYMMANKDSEFNQAYEALKENIVDVFTDITNVSPELDHDDYTVKLGIQKGDYEFELGSQGDGIKRVLMFFTTMHAAEGMVLLIDEPENYLHPKLASEVIPFFIEYGKGQAVIATHSEAVLSGISDDRIENGDVIIYTVGLDETNCSRIKQGKDSDIVRVLSEIGVPQSRFLLHMAALAKTLVFVEGESDEEVISLILEKFGQSHSLKRFNPFFIPYHGKGNVTKLYGEIIDSIRKGDDSLDTPSVSIMIIQDRDELDSNRPVVQYDDNSCLFTWSVREVENLVISEKSIKLCFKDFCDKIDDKRKWSSFEKHLFDEIEIFIPKWLYLHAVNMIRNSVRIEWEHGPKTIDVQTARLRIEKTLDETVSLIEKERESLQTLSEKKEELLSKCGSVEIGLNYDFITKEIPGKRFFDMIKSALIKTLEREISEKEQNQLFSVASNYVNVKQFINYCNELPEDISKFLDALERIQSTF